MNVTQESTDDLTALLKLSLSETDYRERVDNQLKDYRKKANMPGFRQGKVPMGIIKKMYGKTVLVEEVNKLVSDGLNNYINDNKIDVLGYPLPNEEKSKQINFDTQTEFDFFFDIAIAPEVTIELNDKISVPYYKIKVDDTMIENSINDAKVRFGEEEYPETAAENSSLQGKLVQVDEEGNAIEGGVENTTFFNIADIKLKTTIKKFVGKKIDDKVIFNPMKAYKDEHKVQHLLGLGHEEDDAVNSDYEFTVNKIIFVKEAEINEELFKKVYPNDDITTEEDFRARLAEELAQHYTRDTDRQFLADTINTLIEKADIKLPDDFMKRWLLESNQGKISKGQLDTQYDSYAKTMKWQIIEGKIMESHGDRLKVDQEEVRNKVRAYFTQMGPAGAMGDQIEGIIDSVLSNKEESQRIYNDILDEKYIAFFKENIKFKEKEVDSKKFSEIVSNTK
ncbi:MAG: trigger factor [Chlorobi bacterium]|nr:trigger factor [Chlorobiota bacterium]